VLDVGALKDRWRARWPWLDRLLTVQERFAAIGGGPLSSSITLAMFLSLFPLLLVVIAILGFLSAGRADFTADVISELGLQGEAAQTVEDAIAIAEDSRQAASILGLLGLLWAGLAVVGALQAALNAAWQVTGRGLLDRVVALKWLLGAGTLFLATAALGPLLSWLPGWLRIGNVAIGAAVTTVLFLWTFTSLGNSSVGWRVHLPGALVVAVGFEILKLVGAIYVPRLVSGSSALYGSIGVVFATLAWLAIYARLIVHGAVLNVVQYEAAAGTVTVEIEVPRIEGEVPLTANRGGAVEERVEAREPVAD
jgi:membrane protein